MGRGKWEEVTDLAKSLRVPGSQDNTWNEGGPEKRWPN